MAQLLTIPNLGAFVVLVLLEAVLSLDHLLSISVESERAPVAQQRAVRFWGAALGLVMRVVLLFVVVGLIRVISAPLLVFGWRGVLEGGINLATILLAAGGVLVIHRTVKEIARLFSLDHLEHDLDARPGRPGPGVLATMLALNTVFGFEAVMTGLAVTDVFLVLLAAIVVVGIAMIAFTELATVILEKRRMLVVLGLFALLLVGVMLLGQAGTAAAEATGEANLQLRVFGTALTPMSRATFYVAVIVLIVVGIGQTRYQRQLGAERHAEQRR